MFVQAQCLIRWPETPWGWRPAEQWTGRGEDQGFVLVVAVIYVLINLFTDLAYRALDPRLAGK